MAKELVKFAENNTRNHLSLIFLIIMKNIHKVGICLLLVVIGSLFSFHVLKKKNALQWFLLLELLFSRQERTVCGTGKGLISL